MKKTPSTIFLLAKGLSNDVVGTAKGAPPYCSRYGLDLVFKTGDFVKEKLVGKVSRGGLP